MISSVKPLHTLALLSAFVLPLGCDPGGTPPPADAQDDRGPLGKADLAGTCGDLEGNDFCGGPSDGACWCDDACEAFGDCCNDKQMVCDAAPACSSNEDCGAGQYCAAPACDMPGECLAMPLQCTLEAGTLCGCDGNEYINACFANGNGTNVDHAGPCEEPPSTACLGNDECGLGEFCAADGCGVEGQCEAVPTVCTLEAGQFCGCDGNEYINECFANGSATNVAHAGPC
jgi:hypothetical protein